MKAFFKTIVKKAAWFGVTYRVFNSDNIFLTFDDGPHSLYTEEILKILREYKVRATFFMVGENIEKYPDLVRQILKEEHAIGYHGYTHRRLDKMDLRSLKREIERMARILSKFNNYRTRLFRPPYGKISAAAVMYLLLKRIKIVLWTVDSKDSFGFPQEAVCNILRNHSFKGGDIILFHDDNSSAAKVLPWLIQVVRSKKMEFETL